MQKQRTPTGCRRRNTREYRTYKTNFKQMILTTYSKTKEKIYTSLSCVGIFQQNHHNHEFQYGEFCSITPLEYSKIGAHCTECNKIKSYRHKRKKSIAITLSALIHSFEVHLQFRNYPLEICCAVGHLAYLWHNLMSNCI